MIIWTFFPDITIFLDAKSAMAPMLTALNHWAISKRRVRHKATQFFLRNCMQTREQLACETKPLRRIHCKQSKLDDVLTPYLSTAFTQSGQRSGL